MVRYWSWKTVVSLGNTQGEADAVAVVRHTAVKQMSASGLGAEKGSGVVMIARSCVTAGCALRGIQTSLRSLG